MKEQVRMSRPVSRRIVMPLLIAFSVLVAGGGLVSYAAVDGWLPWVFLIDEEGTVTKSGKVVGGTYENEDGSTTTVIGNPEGVEYRIHTDEPLYGRRLMINPVTDE